MIQYAVISEDGEILSLDKSFAETFSVKIGEKINSNFPCYESIKSIFSFREFVHEEHEIESLGQIEIFSTEYSSKKAALVLLNREKTFEAMALVESEKKNAVYDLMRSWKKIVEEEGIQNKLDRAVQAASSMGWEKILFCYNWKEENYFSSRGYNEFERKEILSSLPFDLPEKFDKTMSELSKVEGIYYIVPGHRRFNEIIGNGKDRHWHPGYLIIIPMKRSRHNYAGWLMFDDPMDKENPVREDVFNLVGFFQSLISELDVLQTASELIKSQKERETILYEIAHDLKNPLSIIRIYAETLLRGEVDQDKMCYFSEVIIEKSKHILSMVEDMLELAKLQNIEYLLDISSVDLKDVVRKSLLSQSDFAESRNISFDINLPKKFAFVEGDEDLLIRAVENIINNAVKFSKENSTVLVSILDEGDKWLLTVEDRGIGILEEEIGNIFRKFYRSADAKIFPGSGLGLSIVERIIALHEGEIEIQSSKGERTCVSLRFRKREDE
ncbi:HAMP domain-containing histidine kinase [candidate division WOR-3 bacterium]|nr:HAMP domain-containing histidine kinase [candidate division WOR-3 bacterium]